MYTADKLVDSVELQPQQRERAALHRQAGYSACKRRGREAYALRGLTRAT